MILILHSNFYLNKATGIDQIKQYPLKDISDTELDGASTLKPFQIDDGELSGRAGASSWDSDRDWSFVLLLFIDYSIRVRKTGCYTVWRKN